MQYIYVQKPKAARAMDRDSRRVPAAVPPARDASDDQFTFLTKGTREME
jgi:hypothetical protein